MKLGLLTAAFPDLDLEQVAEWSAGNGFAMLEIACWPSSGGERRRYAGVCHIDVDALDAGRRPQHDGAPWARDLLARLLPEQPPPRSGRARGRERAPAQGDRRSGGDRRRRRRHLRRPRQDPQRARQPRRVPQGLAAARRVRGGTRRQDRDRELPDDLLPRRVAGRRRTWLRRPRSGTSCSRSSRARRSGSTSTPRTSSG